MARTSHEEKSSIFDSCMRQCTGDIYDPVCLRWEMAECDGIKIHSCERFIEKRLDEDEYCPSATAGDYSPSNPWDAPGMSIRDFI